MEIFEKLKGIIAEELPNVDAGSISMDSRFKEDLQCDSLDVAQIVVAIEDVFSIEIPLDATTSIRTVGEAVEAIRKAVG